MKNKANHPSQKSKLLRLVLVGGIALVLTVLVFSGFSMRDKYATEAQVDEVRNVMSQLVSELKMVNEESEWRDTSYCAVYEPRSFGDSTSYSCEVSYVGESIMIDENVLGDEIARYQSVLKGISRIEITKDIDTPTLSGNESHKEIYSSSFTVKNVPTEICGMNYHLRHSNLQYELTPKLRCQQSTQDAYFEPIKYL